jgi:hypothetical protein
MVSIYLQPAGRNARLNGVEVLTMKRSHLIAALLSALLLLCASPALAQPDARPWAANYLSPWAS